MRVLYAVQATGNGHLSRAIEFYPIMSKYADVDVLLSGIQGDLKLNFPVKAKMHGAGFVFGKNGGIDYLRTAIKTKPFRFFYDVFKLDLRDYDLIVSDFEPISTWAAKWTNIARVGLSHQASFLSSKSPRPIKHNKFGEFLYRQFAPVDRYIGLHYKSFDKNIYTPVVRKAIRQLHLSEKDHVVVYLPAFSENVYKKYLKKIKSVSWKIFSKHAKKYSKEGNIEVFPIDNDNWMKYLSSAYGAIIGAGFASTSEMLYLKKRFLAIPMNDQYEQLCNAVALENMGVDIIREIDNTFQFKVQSWLERSKAISIDFPDQSEEIVKDALGLI
ncbi:MAG: glycosyltransferase family protein [Saprospiraceae bacterium]